MQFARQDTLRPDFVRLKDALEASTATVDVRYIREEPAWFFAGHRFKSAEILVKVTADWLVALDSARRVSHE
jgi:hypothetical protein